MLISSLLPLPKDFDLLFLKQLVSMVLKYYFQSLKNMLQTLTNQVLNNVGSHTLVLQFGCINFRKICGIPERRYSYGRQVFSYFYSPKISLVYA